MTWRADIAVFWAFGLAERVLPDMAVAVRYWRSGWAALAVLRQFRLVAQFPLAVAVAEYLKAIIRPANASVSGGTTKKFFSFWQPF
jgi:hypothetical protein